MTTLEEYIKQHKEEIVAVDLICTYSTKCRCESYESDEYYYSMKYIDTEYSFKGTVEDAIIFSQNYDVWDDRDDKLQITGGVLHGCIDNSNESDNEWNVDYFGELETETEPL